MLYFSENSWLLSAYRLAYCFYAGGVTEVLAHDPLDQRFATADPREKFAGPQFHFQIIGEDMEIVNLCKYVVG